MCRLRGGTFVFLTLIQRYSCPRGEEGFVFRNVREKDKDKDSDNVSEEWSVSVVSCYRLLYVVHCSRIVRDCNLDDSSNEWPSEWTSERSREWEWDRVWKWLWMSERGKAFSKKSWYECVYALYACVCACMDIFSPATILKIQIWRDGRIASKEREVLVRMGLQSNKHSMRDARNTTSLYFLLSSFDRWCARAEARASTMLLLKMMTVDKFIAEVEHWPATRKLTSLQSSSGLFTYAVVHGNRLR